jgi:Spy/CpxP family protein refolding chaperone
MCRRCHAVAERGGCRPTSRARHAFHDFEHHHYPGDRGLGVRRPLRFLVWKLGLDERQVAELATVLSRLKTERAQAEVDDRRALALLADAVQGEAFDHAAANQAAKLRAASAERLQRIVAESLAAIHAALDSEQRGRLAYLLRTGTLVM